MDDQKLFLKYVGFVQKMGSDVKRRVSAIKPALLSLKADSREAFMITVAETDPFAVVLAVNDNKILFTEEQENNIRQELSRICGSLLTGKGSEIISGDNISSVLSTAVFLNDERLFAKAVSVYSSLDAFIPQCEKIISMITTTRGGSLYAARLFSWMYDCVDQDIQIKMIEKVVYDKSLVIPDTGKLDAEVVALAERTLSDNKFRYLYHLIQLITGLRAEESFYDEGCLMKKVFSLDDSDEINYGMLLMEDRCYYLDEDNEKNGIKHWWDIICRYEDTSNEVWIKMRGWFEMYYLSKRICTDPVNADEYIEQAVPVRETTFLPTTRSVKTVHATVETLILSGSRYILDYLNKIENANVYRYYSGCTVNKYCSDSNCSVDLKMLVRMLKDTGYSRRQMFYIYLNSYMRRLVWLDKFLRQVFAYTGGSNRVRSIDLSGYLGIYRIPAVVIVADDGTVNIKPKGLSTVEMWIDNVWKRRNTETAKALLKNNNEITIKILSCDAQRFTCRAVPIDPETGEELCDSTSGVYEYMLELLSEVEQLGELTTGMNRKITALNAGVLSKEQHIALSIAYLRCCVSIVKNKCSVRYFINMIIGEHYETENYYQHNRLKKNAPVERYDREVFAQVIECWQGLRYSDISADDLFFIYINTILKHCVSFSSVIFSRFANTRGEINVQRMLSRYTDYFFSGRITFVDLQKGYLFLNPNEFSVNNRVKRDSYIYYFDVDDHPYYRRDLECFFKVKSYSPADYTFTVTDLTTEKMQRELAPENIFINALFNVSYSFDISERKIRDINVDGLRLNEREVLRATDAILNALVNRSNSSSDLMRYMVIIDRNNPWRFSLDAFPGMEKYTHTIAAVAQCESVIQRLCAEFTEKNIVAVYFNSPMRCFTSIEELVDTYSRSGRNREELIECISKYPLVVKDGSCINYNCRSASLHTNDGVYTLSCNESGDISFSLCSFPQAPRDFSSEQLDGIIQSIKLARNSKT